MYHIDYHYQYVPEYNKRLHGVIIDKTVLLLRGIEGTRAVPGMGMSNTWCIMPTVPHRLPPISHFASIVYRLFCVVVQEVHPTDPTQCQSAPSSQESEVRYGRYGTV